LDSKQKFIWQVGKRQSHKTHAQRPEYSKKLLWKNLNLAYLNAVLKS
jgi:hypothetical protein